MVIGFCRAVAALALAACCHTGQAQTAEETARNINAVKRDTTYLYAEATTKDLSEAYQGAKAILEVKVSDWVRAQHPGENIELCIVKAKEHFIQIETRRGELYRAFVYVRKGDIMPVTDKREVTVFEVAAESASPQSEKVMDGVISEDAQVTPEPAPRLSSEEERMKAIRNFYDIEPYIKGLEDKGLLRDYGKYATLPADGTCHLLVYDRKGSIAAVIRREGDGRQVSLSTQEEDDVKNYKNCGAIWLRLK